MQLLDSGYSDGNLTYLDTTNSELYKSTEHLSAGNLVGSTADSALDEQAVIMGLIMVC